MTVLSLPLSSGGHVKYSDYPRLTSVYPRFGRGSNKHYSRRFLSQSTHFILLGIHHAPFNLTGARLMGELYLRLQSRISDWFHFLFVEFLGLLSSCPSRMNDNFQWNLRISWRNHPELPLLFVWFSNLTIILVNFRIDFLVLPSIPPNNDDSWEKKDR